MNPEEDNFNASRIESVSPILAAAVVLIGGFILIGWAFDFEFLRSGLPGLPATKVSAAMAFIIFGAALRFPHSRHCVHQAQGLAMVAILLSLLTLEEHLLGRNLWLDQILIRDYSQPLSSHPGRMAPLVSLIFMILSAGIITFRPKEGFVARFISRGPDEIILRGLLFPSSVLLIILGFAEIMGEKACSFEPSFGHALITLISVSILVAILWFNARDLDRTEETREVNTYE
jgi:hypothetical protein